MNEMPDRLLATDEPPPFTVDNEYGASPLLIVADHAGKHFPRRLGQLGLSNAECERHIAWVCLLKTSSATEIWMILTQMRGDSLALWTDLIKMDARASATKAP